MSWMVDATDVDTGGDGDDDDDEAHGHGHGADVIEDDVTPTCPYACAKRDVVHAWLRGPRLGRPVWHIQLTVPPHGS